MSTKWNPEFGKAQFIELLMATKRPGNMAHAIHDSYEWLGDNAYFGFTAENQEWYDRRFDKLFWNLLMADKYWVSAEPLLGPIDLGTRIVNLNWVVVGCESGPKRRPCKTEWVESIVEQCRNHKIPVFVKQLDIDGKCVTDITKFPKHLRIRQVPWEVAK